MMTKSEIQRALAVRYLIKTRGIKWARKNHREVCAQLIKRGFIKRGINDNDNSIK